MVVALFALAVLGQQPELKVTSTFELIEGKAKNARELDLSRKHRWMLMGPWSEHYIEILRQGATKLLQWRASPSSDDAIRDSLVANWKAQLAHPKVANLANLTRDLLATIPNNQFPGAASPQGKWFRWTVNGQADWKGDSQKAAKLVAQFASNQWNDLDIRCYLLLRKTAGMLTAYLMVADARGEQLDLIPIKLLDQDPAGRQASAVETIFPKGSVAPMLPELLDRKSFIEGVPAKNLDLAGMEKQGVDAWFQAKIAPTFKGISRPMAILADDVTTLEFLKLGGNYAAFLNSHGYRVVPSEGIDFVMPENFVEAETITINAPDMLAIDPRQPSGEIIRKYAVWVQKSGLIASFDRLSYLEAALSWQRDLPLMSENIYPLLPILANIGKIDLALPVYRPLLGSTAGEQGNRLIRERIGDPFVLGPRLPSEMRIGYAWGPNGREQLASVTLSTKREEQMYFKSLLASPKNTLDMADELRAYGNTWDSILASAANKTIDVQEGDLVTITFQCASNRIMSGDMFFRRRKIYTGPFQDLPKERMASLKESAIAIIEGMKDEKTAPPPP